jgi:hypothetical protein
MLARRRFARFFWLTILAERRIEIFLRLLDFQAKSTNWTFDSPVRADRFGREPLVKANRRRPPA